MGRLISLVLWTYRTSKRTSTQATPFSLVYGAESVVLIEVLVPSTRLALASKISSSDDRIGDVKPLDEKQQSAEEKRLSYQRQISRAYNKRGRPHSQGW